jgi:uncharacterized protein YigE (DUF2233 family)
VRHPTTRLSLSSVLLLVALSAALLGRQPTATASSDEPYRLLDVGWTQHADATRVVARLTGNVRYRTGVAGDVIRVDLWPVAGDVDNIMDIDGGIASRITVRRLAPDIVRIGINVRDQVRYKVYRASDGLTVTVFPRRLSTVPLPQSVNYRALRIATGGGRTRVHVVTLDPRSGGVTVQPALGGAAVSAVETTSTAATRSEALAAINGTYYSYAGLPLGLVVIDGRVLSTPLPRRPVFAVDAAGRAWIGDAEMSARLVTDSGRVIPISAINRPPRIGGLALYTPEFGPLTFPQVLVAFVRGDHVTGFSSGRPLIPHDGYALAAAESQQDLLLSLVRGEHLTLDVALSPAGTQQALQGGPRLVRNGRIYIPYGWEGFRHSFYRVRTARSAIGITATGKILFVTVDGRTRQNSGMNLPELAGLMRDLGAADAMNLDGGGSTTLVVGGRVVSALPHGGERRVASMLVALRRRAAEAP